MQCLDEGGQEALEAFLDEHPEQAEWIRSRLRELHGAGLLSSENTGSDEVPDQLGEFRLHERLGVGGMGVVYRAEQPSLKRWVALKLIRPEHLYFPHSKERFRREVQTIAQLQHPNIVRVYEVGDEKGLPYFTMECVPGVSLGTVLRELIKDSPARLDDQALHDVLQRLRGASVDGADLFVPRGKSWVEVCFRWIKEIADCLVYAHGEGVLHRDLKPSNLMLTWDGRVMLLDFGLASTKDGSRITKSGAPVGSLAYMAPEQIRREGAKATERTDVYGLGVTLYELLALRHPFHEEGNSLDQTSRRIAEGTAPSLRTPQRSIPWDAETVCLAAMDRDPTRRYADVAAFARDLDNVLQFRPIEARRPGPALRMRRFTQRRPAASLGIAVALLLLIGGPLALWRAQVARTRAVQEEQRKTQAALETVEEQRMEILAQSRLAEKRFETAVQSVASVLLQIGFVELRDVPNSVQVRHDLLDIAEKSARGLLHQMPDHPRAREIAARVDHFQAQLLLEEERFEEMSPPLERALSEFERLWEESPDDVEVALQYALTLNMKGGWARAIQEVSVSVDCYYQALDIYEQMMEVTEGELRDRVRSRSIESLMNLGPYLWRMAEYKEEGLDLIHEGRALAEEAVDEFPNEKNRRLLALLLVNLGSTGSDKQESVELSEEAIEILRSLVKDSPTDRDHRFNLASVLSNHGLFLQRINTPESNANAQELFDEAIPLLEKLCQDFPDQGKFELDLAVTRSRNALLAQTLKKPPEMIKAMVEECLPAHDRACERGIPMAHHSRAWTRFSLYQALLEMNQPEEAREVLRTATRDVERVRDQFPGWEWRFDQILDHFARERESASEGNEHPVAQE